MPGQRHTSDRRRAPGQKVTGRVTRVTGSRVARRETGEPGPLQYDGDDAVVCPSCGARLDPKRKGAGPGTVPKHARYGWTTSARGKAPCRGWVESLPVSDADGG